MVDDKKNIIGGPISDEVFDSLPFISIEDGLKMRTGQPTPNDPDIEAAKNAMEEAETFGTISLEDMKRLLKPTNIVNLGLRRLMRSRSPWE